MKKETIVINIRKKNLVKLGYKDLVDWLKDPNHIYIGRHNCFVEGTFSSKWRNKFSVKKFGREKCIKKYREYLLANNKLMNDLDELNGKVLGCWCYPNTCHGDVLCELVNGKEVL